MKKIERIEVRIREAVEAAQANGWRLLTGYWMHALTGSGHTVPACCALGALLRDEKRLGLQESTYERAAAKKLGVTRDWVKAFTAGFDGCGLDDGDRQAWELGRKFRRDYIGY